jgi:putative ABC transport system permease protein
VKPPDETKQSGTGRSSSVEYGLTYDDGARIQSTIPGVQRVLPIRIIRETVRFADRAAPCQVLGTLPFYTEIVNLDVVRGRFLTETDEINQNNVCVLSTSLAAKLFPYQDPLEQSVKIDAFYYRVIGLAREKDTAEQRPQSGRMEGEPLDNNIYVSLSTVRSRFGETITRRSASGFEVEKVQLHQITVRMKGLDAVEAGDNEIKALLARFHNQNDYEAIVPLQLLRQAEQTKYIFNIVLGSIAAISLIVGGIGIMNIMLATVTERTREIGVRRALGAKRGDITMQFLVETVILSIGGGLIGVLLGVIAPMVVSHLTTMKTIVTPWSVLLAFGISGLVGIIFGLYPAKSAAQLDPIEALRHE